jgi:hypothetical protein
MLSALRMTGSGAHARGEEGLVAVAHGGVGDLDGHDEEEMGNGK